MKWCMKSVLTLVSMIVLGYGMPVYGADIDTADREGYEAGESSGNMEEAYNYESDVDLQSDVEPEFVMTGSSQINALTCTVEHTNYAGRPAICLDGNMYFLADGITCGNYNKNQVVFSSDGTLLHIKGDLGEMPRFRTEQCTPQCYSCSSYNSDKLSVCVGIWPRKYESLEEWSPEIWKCYPYQDTCFEMDVDCSDLDGIYSLLLYFNGNCAVFDQDICVYQGQIYYGWRYNGYTEACYRNYSEFKERLNQLNPPELLTSYLGSNQGALLTADVYEEAQNSAEGCVYDYDKALAVYRYFETNGDTCAYDNEVAVAMLAALRIPAINSSCYGLWFYDQGWHNMDVSKTRYANCQGYFDSSEMDLIGRSNCYGELIIYDDTEETNSYDDWDDSDWSYDIEDYSLTEQFVVRLYDRCLGRQPDAEGLEHWNTILVNKERSGAEVAYGFVFSQEYRNKNTSDEDYVEMLYNVFLDRSSDKSGKEHWLHVLSCGVSREYVFRGFAESQEYTNICQSYGIDRGMVSLTQARDKNINVTSFVNRMYTMALGRDGEEAGLNHWCNAILTGERTPEEVAEAFINSEEFRNKNLCCENYIKVLYRTFMGREYDQEGLDHWMAEWRRGNTKQDILHRFATSQEFKNIQASFGL